MTPTFYSVNVVGFMFVWQSWFWLGFGFFVWQGVLLFWWVFFVVCLF